MFRIFSMKVKYVDLMSRSKMKTILGQPKTAEV